MNVARIYIFGMEIVIYIYSKKIVERLCNSYRGKIEIFRLHSRFNFLKIVGKV